MLAITVLTWKKHKQFHESNPLFKARNYVGRTKNSLNSEKNQENYKRKHDEDLSEDLTKYTRDSVKEKIYYTLPRPKRGKWIVILEQLWNSLLSSKTTPQSIWINIKKENFKHSHV